MSIVSQAELIKGAKLGKVVSFPTDTVPGLAVKPEKSELIFLTKKRALDKPLILMAASFPELIPYLKGTNEELEIWQEVAKKYLPGALTLVLPASELVPKEMNPTNNNTIGVRVPNLPLAQAILAETQPLATTSANFSGEPPLEKMAEIAASFPNVLTLDCGELNTEKIGSGLPSTVAKWTGNGWQILRQGSVNLLYPGFTDQPLRNQVYA